MIFCSLHEMYQLYSEVHLANSIDRLLYDPHYNVRQQ